MLQTPTKLAKNLWPKNIILLIRSPVRHCTVRQSPLSRYGQISVCKVMLAVRHRSVRPTGRNVPMMGEFQPICYQPSPASPAQPSPAQPSTVMRDEKKPSSVCKWCVQCCEGPDFVQKVSLFMRNLEATVSVFLSKLARNNYSEQSAPSPQSPATAKTGAGEKMSENNNNH